MIKIKECFYLIDKKPLKQIKGVIYNGQKET